MTTYSDWERIEIPTLSIDLDVENPRFFRTCTSQNDVIDILLHGKFDIVKLGKSIASLGFTPLDNIIVYHDANSRNYVVLEGNRRITALKLLLNPNLAKVKSVEKCFIQLSDGLSVNQKKDFLQIEVIVAPSRRAADKLLLNRHTTTPIKSWSPIMQAQFVYERVQEHGTGKASQDLSISSDELKKFINRYHYFKLAEHLLGQEFDRNEFNITTLERVLGAQGVKEYLGVHEEETVGLSTNSDKDDFEKSFKRIANAVSSNETDSRKFNKAAEILSWIKKIKKPKKSPKRTSFEQLYSSKRPAKPNPSRSPSSASAPPLTKLFPKDLECEDSNSRLIKITEELTKLGLKQYPNAVAVLFRVFLEIACLRFIEYNDLNTGFQRHKNTVGNKSKGDIANAMGFLADQNNSALPQNLARVVAQLKNKDFFASLSTIQEFVHNPEMIPTETDLRDLWEQTETFIRHIMKRD